MLTDIEIRKLRPGPKPFKAFDERGLYLLVTPTGGKLWRLKFRFGGVEKLLALGKYPEVGLKAAREKRDSAREQQSEGVDPAKTRQAEKVARVAAQASSEQHTLKAVALAWHKHRANKWNAETAANILTSLTTHVFAYIGDRPIAEVTPAEIREVVQRVDASGASDLARRVLQRLGSVCRHAVAHQLITIDPTYALKPEDVLRPHKVTHRASMPVREVPDFLRKLDAYDGETSTSSALALLVLTALRPGEVRGASWSEFDLDAGIWTVPAARMKMKQEHLVPLSRQALRLVKALREKKDDSEHLVFPSPFYPGKPISENTMNSALARMGFKGIATAHGFRTLFSTAANEHGMNSDAIEKQLSHEERDEVRGAYNRAEYLPQRVKLMQWWADRLDKMRKGADVIPIRAA